ncbi:PREDICTED: olfactory receptor 2T34-like [Elephantulus edwardii]|uniref:olfactory receptor 2T34-like n=1 Tax=Elephantulus edwardii TaxID=28737 RepID=UPI0003F074CB|nr:PREDICTED: olfactory receptor 2T34-like [Elephantulus edwardii]
MHAGNKTSENQTSSTYFILTGLFDKSKYAVSLYTLIFIFFLMALTENVLLIVLIHREPRLHTPMYFFINQLSLMDLMYICVTVPKMLVSQVTGDNTISPLGCGVQMFSHLTLAGAEFSLLAAMAYDRYAAICRPLHYQLLMKPRFCQILASGCWFLGMFDGLVFAPMTMSFPYCHSRKILNFFCEAPALLKLSCSDTTLYEMLMYLCCVLMLLIPITIISTSYALILHLIHRMNSAEGRKKAFATCSSHLLVVLLFFGTSIYNYMLPRPYHTAEQDIRVSAFYTIITPVLNPLIYSLRNKDIIGALKNILPLEKRVRKIANGKN